MDRPMPSLGFKLMSLALKVRDLFLPPMSILNEVGIEPGAYVLDYGCGPGAYIVPLADLVGESGRIYALDVHPLAIESVQRTASTKKLTNVETICSDCATGLPDSSVDVVLLCDTLHLLSNPNGVLQELRRVLKPEGVLSVSDHHMKENELTSTVTNSGLFGLSGKGKRTYSFSRQGGQ